MSEMKEIPLDGAYYGPSVPPQRSHENQHSRRSRGCCLLSTFLKVLIAIVVTLGIAAVVFWLVVRPTKLKVYVVSADLTQFDLTNGSTTLNYNLALDMVVRNPNKKIGIYYDRLNAVASYEGERFGWASMPRFYQGHKNTTNMLVNFRGQQVIVLRGSEINRFNQDRNNGFFDIELKLYARIRFKLGSLKTRRVKPDIECNLRIPLTSNGTFARGFQRTRCDDLEF